VDELVAFLAARLDDEEEAARDMARSHPAPWSADAAFVYDAGGGLVLRDEYHWEAIRYAARHDPARVLADVAADRKLLAMYEAQAGYDLPEGVHDGRDPGERERDEAVKDALEEVVKIRAGRFDSHPDYKPEWRPS
jgi:hypothetical protein